MLDLALNLRRTEENNIKSYFLEKMYQPIAHKPETRFHDYFKRFANTLNLNQDTRVFFELRMTQLLIERKYRKRVINSLKLQNEEL